MRILNAILVLIFILLRTSFDPWMRSLNIWQSYGIEASICLLFIALNFKSIRFHFTANKSYGVHALVSIALGTLIAYFGIKANRVVPFDFRDPLLWVQLIVVAPLLEEALFRLLIWDTLKSFLKNSYLVIFVTAVLFSLSHFAAYYMVPEQYQPFVIYQTIYTLVLGLHWGWERNNARSWLAPVALHFLVNLSFGLTHYLASPPPLTDVPTVKPLKILIVDMPTGNLSIFKDSKSPIPIYSLYRDKSTAIEVKDCAAINGKISSFYEHQQKNQPMALSNSDADAILDMIVKSHGYHVLGLVQKDLTNSEIYTLGLSPPPGEKGITDPKNYLEHEIKNDLTLMTKTIDEVKPDLVLTATSETFEENFADLKTAGFSDADAKMYATQIFSTWKDAWSKLLSTHSNILFIVPAGNGGLDGIGDDIAVTQVIPAALQADNLVKVASIGTNHCLSKFSNYHATLVGYAVPGEVIESWSPCSANKSIKISGTSQAAAIFTNRVARVLETGASVADFMKEYVTTADNCLKGKIKVGVVTN